MNAELPPDRKLIKLSDVTTHNVPFIKLGNSKTGFLRNDDFKMSFQLLLLLDVNLKSYMPQLMNL